MRRLLGEFMAVARGSTPNHLHLRNRIGLLIGLVVIVDAAASVGVYLLEKDAPGSDIHDWGDSIFWTTAQLLTVSSSLSNPVTGWGKVVDVVLMFVAITLVAALAATFGSFLYRLSVENAPHPLVDSLKGLIKEKEAELEKMRAENPPPAPTPDSGPTGPTSPAPPPA